MMSYPELTTQQQQGLPVLLAPATLVPSEFSDSTHQVWLCQTSDGLMVLKICQLQTIELSSFWSAVNQLFGLQFPRSLDKIHVAYDLVAQSTHVMIPNLIVAESSGFVMTRYVEGDDVSYHMVSKDMATQLAGHLAQLHQRTFSQWGPIFNPEFSSQAWSARLQQTLISLAATSSIMIADNILNKALQQAADIKLTSFSPIMVDLRWDQMLHQQGRLAAIVDMDAFVIGPTALELILLEYQLSQDQADYFAEHYQLFLPLPELDSQRYCYRLLLFLMNSLGETDLDKWMLAPERF
jgi:hypothetical protein